VWIGGEVPFFGGEPPCMRQAFSGQDLPVSAA
jgi:hypothetical protein